MRHEPDRIHLMETLVRYGSGVEKASLSGHAGHRDRERIFDKM